MLSHGFASRQEARLPNHAKRLFLVMFAPPEGERVNGGTGNQVGPELRKDISIGVVIL